MLLIPCPHCGARSHDEFTYGQQPMAPRPDASAPLQTWTDWVHLRANPKGPLVERWHHTHGCRAWIVVERDTVTHRVTAVGLPGATPTRLDAR